MLDVNGWRPPHAQAPAGELIHADEYRAAPGVAGAAVWYALVERGTGATRDPAALTFLTTTSRLIACPTFELSDAGKTAVYMVRWINTRGEKGPWSGVALTTVTA